MQIYYLLIKSTIIPIKYWIFYLKIKKISIIAGEIKKLEKLNFIYYYEKLSVLFAAVMMFVSMGTAKAQKVATVDVEAILSMMPEKKKQMNNC